MFASPTPLPQKNLALPLGNPVAAREVLRLVVLFAIGIALPAACHLLPIGNTGPMLLPILIPVVLGAFLLPLRSAIAVAVGLPLLSFALSGMPPFSPPIAPILMAEGIVAVLVIRGLHRAGVSHWVLLLAAAMLASRGISFAAGALVLGKPLQLAAASTAWGFVGWTLQFALVPVLARLLRAEGGDSAA